MRNIQYRILMAVLNKVPIPDYIYAFEKNKSVPKMARVHVGKRVVISLDIKDFFHSIKQVRLAGIFESLGFSEKPARTLSELCTYKAYVPQGGLTSPKLSNIVAAMTFGPKIKEYCDGAGLALTIYADDITVSFNGSRPVGPILEALTNFVVGEGFKINHQKTKVMTKSRRQYVCGVVVNEKPNLVREERKRLRAIVHNIVTKGIEGEAAKNSLPPEKFAEVIRGKVNWFRQLNPGIGDKLMSSLSAYLADWQTKHYTETSHVTEPTEVQPTTEVVSLELLWEEPATELGPQA